MSNHRARIASIALVLGAAVSGASAQEEAKAPEKSWTNTTELAYVSTTGNSETTNLAFTEKFVYRWTASELTIDAAALRTDTTTRFLSNPDGTVRVEDVNETTAERYAAAGKYRHTIREGFFAYGLGGWLRDRFAGIEDRYNAGVGLGYRILKTEAHTLAAELGADYADETRIDATSDTFMSARGFVGYEYRMSGSAKLTSEMELLENLETTEDLRGKWVTALTATMTKKLALKLSYTILYDRLPVEVLVEGDAPGVPAALYSYDETDTITAAALVINW